MARPGSLLVLVALLSGCMYGFVGGGLPSHIRTVAILPFENETPHMVENEIVQRLQTELPRNLGVRLAEESRADAVIRGRVLSFDESPVSVRPTQQDQSEVNVIQRQVRIAYELEIYDVREDRPLWRAQGQTALGSFYPDNGETAQNGQERAIRDLVEKVIEGAQSQW